MALPGHTEVMELLEEYNVSAQVTTSWVANRRDRFVVPWVARKIRQPLEGAVQKTEYVSGTGESVLVLSARPVVDLISISYVVAPATPPLSILSVEVLKPEGILKAKTNWEDTLMISYFPRGKRNIRVIYTVGGATIPPDLGEAICCFLAERVLAFVGSRTGGGSLSVPGYNRQFGSRGKWSDIRNDLTRQGLAILRGYMSGVTVA